VLLVLLAAGGGAGWRYGYVGPGYYGAGGIVGLLLIIVILLILFGRL